MEPDKSRSRSKGGTSRKRATAQKPAGPAEQAAGTLEVPESDAAALREPAASSRPSNGKSVVDAPELADSPAGPSRDGESGKVGAVASSSDVAPETVDARGDGAADVAPEQGAGAHDDGLVPVPGASFAELPLDSIVPNTRQPRQVFDEEELDELAASIREVGVLQPVVVRPLQGATEDGPQYELIMGERRWRASRLAGNDTVPAVIRETGDGQLLRDALLENLHRADLNPLEEAAAYQQLLEDFGCTHDELASRIARSRPQISNTLRLMKLPPLVQRRVAAGVLSAGHARALLGLSDGAAMERLAQKIVAEGLSVRATEEIVALGDEPVAPEMRRRPRPTAHAEDLNRLATRLADRLDTRVKVNLGQRKGRIAIEFASVEDLNRILDVLAPGEDHIPAN